MIECKTNGRVYFFPNSVCLGRAGVPMEVMGLMLGEFVDDYTVRVIDVFAMPQSGTVGGWSLSKCTLPLNYTV